MTGNPIDTFRLEGQLALVTGASGGLGAHFAELLARCGARVALAARRVERLEELVARIGAAGGLARAYPLDVTDAASVTRCFDALCEWGTPDVVVSNAGVTLTKPLLQQSPEDWDAVLDTNLRGSWLVGTEAARRMVAAKKRGCIVNVGSILGERVAGGVAPYAVSKAGVLQSTKAMALELARHGIRVNALAPGYVATELNDEFLTSEAGQKLKARIPSRRFSALDDLNGPMLLLASDAGRAMSGSVLVVDGGHMVSSL
ncbi:SDR family oxidoreductase [Variovorax ureilyticus]|uniref:SDR family oxidoreductase n=1 Tax=Variovorax ureilyticus TaxID=1836198 RepID=A0ABU8VLT5_9BURK